MLQGYHLITLTHKTAPLEAIGQLIPSSEQLPTRLHALKDAMDWEELFCLTTCNRAMFAFYCPQTPGDAALKSALIQYLNPHLSDEQGTELSKYMHVFHSGDAVRHIFEVASSMDSLVVGEREIIRQLRTAYEQCVQWDLTGDHFRLLISQAIEVSKQVFNETGIGEKALSVVALAYQAMKTKGLKPTDHILLVGAGATNELLTKFLVKDGYQHVTVFNRTLSKAEVLAAQFEHGLAFPLSHLEHYTAHFDAMVVCTGAVTPIIAPSIYQKMIGADTSTKILTDLSVPNNISGTVATGFPVHYIEIEDLRELATEHLAYRERARKSAEKIITERLIAFRSLWHERQVERSLRPMIEQIKSVKTRTVEMVFADQFAALDNTAQELVLEMLNYMEKNASLFQSKPSRK